MEHHPRAVGQAMWAGDQASKRLGMELVEVGEGRAVLRMEIRSDMVNGLDVGHGGLVFTLADSAMAYSSNSTNQRSVATQAEIDWLAPARVGSVLTATAVERHRQGKAAVTDVEVVDEEGTRVALFRGRTLQIGGQVITDD
jgi:acyl-CoA thioesterase